MPNTWTSNVTRVLTSPTTSRQGAESSSTRHINEQPEMRPLDVCTLVESQSTMTTPLSQTPGHRLPHFVPTHPSRPRTAVQTTVHRSSLSGDAGDARRQFLLPSYITYSNEPTPERTVHDTGAKTCFQYGIIFGITWFIGWAYLHYPSGIITDLEIGKTEEQQRMEIAEGLENERFWATRCRLAAITFIFLVLAFILRLMVPSGWWSI